MLPAAGSESRQLGFALRRLSLSLAAAALALTMSTGCSSGGEPETTGGDGAEASDTVQPDADTADSADAADATDQEPRTFAVGEAIPVTLTLAGSDDGGRQSAYFAGYRPEVTFAGMDAMPCAFGVPEGVREFAPGATGDIEITCTEEIIVEPDSLGFTVAEGGREVGSGEVRLADAR